MSSHHRPDRPDSEEAVPLPEPIPDEPDTDTPEVPDQIEERITQALEPISAEIGTISSDVQNLAARVDEITTPYEVAGPEVIYRPPLWGAGAAYSAEDDRRLILSAFDPGVIDINDLRVVPRQEGANMSVDVLPGHIVIPGNDYADQGRYLCALGQRVNIPFEPRPTNANVWRREYILAIVEGEQGGQPFWRMVAAPGIEGPTNADPPHGVQPAFQYPSAVMVANVAPVTSTTVAITSDLIYDFRHRARPASTGDSILRQGNLGGIAPPAGSVSWGRFSVLTPPPGPVDVEIRLEGRMAAASAGFLAVGQFQINFSSGGPNWTHQSDWASVTSTRPDDHQWFARTLIATNVQPVYPDQFLIEAAVRHIAGYTQSTFIDGQLTMRISPSGTVLSW